jgi:hypothetical protein
VLLDDERLSRVLTGAWYVLRLLLLVELRLVLLLRFVVVARDELPCTL